MGFTSPQKSAAPARNDQGEFTLSVWMLFVFFSQDSNPLFFFCKLLIIIKTDITGANVSTKREVNF